VNGQGALTLLADGDNGMSNVSVGRHEDMSPSDRRGLKRVRKPASMSISEMSSLFSFKSRLNLR